MPVHPWQDVPLSKDPDEWFPVFIEIPKGSMNKLHIDGYPEYSLHLANSYGSARGRGSGFMLRVPSWCR
jgi:hypothetical protein